MNADHSERMWQMAYDLARTGDHSSSREIAAALQSRGYLQAPKVLNNKRVEDELNRLCREAKEGRVAG